MTLEEAERKIETAARFREMARYMPDPAARAALLETAAAFERAAAAAAQTAGAQS